MSAAVGRLGHVAVYTAAHGHVADDYPIGVPCPAVIERVEKYVIRVALDVLEEAKPVRSAEEYSRDLKALQSDIRTRQFHPGGSMWSAEMRAESGVRGLLLMLWSCMAEVHVDDKVPPPTPDDLTAMYHEVTAEVLIAAALVQPDFTRRAGERRKLPPVAIAAEVKQATEKAEKVTRVNQSSQ